MMTSPVWSTTGSRTCPTRNPIGRSPTHSIAEGPGGRVVVVVVVDVVDVVVLVVVVLVVVVAVVGFGAAAVVVVTVTAASGDASSTEPHPPATNARTPATIRHRMVPVHHIAGADGQRPRHGPPPASE